MKKFKKVFAVMLSLALVLGMTVTVSAAGTKPVPEDSKKVEITNVEAGATFDAYQIIDATYNDSGFTGYVWAAGTPNAGEKVTFDTEGNVVGLTSEVITALAANPASLDKKEGFDPRDAENGKLTAGTWMVLVTPPKTDAVKTYNPMVVSVFYTVEGSGSNNTLATDTLDASENWTLETTDAFAKSSEITVDKSLEKPEFDTEVKVGDTVSFTISSTIPSYDPSYYTNPTFKITDTIVNGLKYSSEPVVTIGTGEDIETLTKGTEYTSDYDAEHDTFTIAFKPEYISSLASATAEERAVTIKYSVEITDDAVKMVGENKATLEYSRTPNETTTKEDKEQVFTFALNGVFGKIGDDGKALPGATFTLYEEVAEAGENTTEIKWSEENSVYATEFDHIVTKEDGKIDFKGLDGDKTYYLMETAAPDGYSINDTIYKIEIALTDPGDEYNGEDVTYTITVTKNKLNEGDEEEDLTKTYTVTINGTDKKGDSSVNVGEFGNAAAGDKINIPNTKLSGLPSTGGIGTTIFTIGGCAIMIIAAGLFFASRRKSSKDVSKE